MKKAVLLRAARYFAGPEPLLHRALEALLSSVRPRRALRLLPCRVDGDGARIGGCFLVGQALREALCGCKEALLLAVTLGQAADRLLARAAALDMAYALALDACASALVEEEAAQALQAFPRALRAPTAPGYVGFPLAGQGALLLLLDAGRRIGLAQTEAGMLAPGKSLLYVAGVPDGETGESPVPAPPCASCGRQDCPYRRLSFPIRP